MSSLSEPAGVRGGLSILYVLHGFPPDTWAGTEVYTLELARAMQARGHRVAVAARAPARDASDADWSVDEDTFQGLRVHRIRRRIDRLALGDSYRARNAAGVLGPILERERPDLVHFQHLLHLSADLVPATKARGIPCVVTLNDYWPLCARVQLLRPDGVRCERNQGMGCFPCVKDKDPRLVPLFRVAGPSFHPFVRALDRVVGGPGAENRIARFTRSWIDLRERHRFVLESLAQADLLVAPSRYLRKRFLETGFFDPERVVHSDYGVGSPAESPAVGPKSPSDTMRFGFVGSLVEHKGIETLLLAMKELAGVACELNVFGAFRPDGDAFHARLREIARGSRVSFRGRFENARVADVYREIDVLVVPSVWVENSPLTIHEAFQFRTPVVTSGIGGMAELVRDGVDGLHARPGDPESLASALKRFVDEPDLAMRLASQTPRVKGVAQDAEETEARYRSLLRGPARP